MTLATTDHPVGGRTVPHLSPLPPLGDVSHIASVLWSHLSHCVNILPILPSHLASISSSTPPVIIITGCVNHYFTIPQLTCIHSTTMQSSRHTARIKGWLSSASIHSRPELGPHSAPLCPTMLRSIHSVSQTDCPLCPPPTSCMLVKQVEPKCGSSGDCAHSSPSLCSEHSALTPTLCHCQHIALQRTNSGKQETISLPYSLTHIATESGLHLPFPSLTLNTARSVPNMLDHKSSPPVTPSTQPSDQSLRVSHTRSDLFRKNVRRTTGSERRLHGSGTRKLTSTLPHCPLTDHCPSSDLPPDMAFRIRYLTYGTSAQLRQEYAKVIPWPTLTEFRVRRKLRQLKRRARKLGTHIFSKSFLPLQQVRKLIRRGQKGGKLGQRGEMYQSTPTIAHSRSSSLTSLLNLIEEANRNLLHSFHAPSTPTEPVLEPPKCPPRLKRAVSSHTLGALPPKPPPEGTSKEAPDRLQLSPLGPDNYQIAFIEKTRGDVGVAEGDTLSVKSLDSYFCPPDPSTPPTDECKRNSKVLCVRSHFQVKEGTVYLEDSDWEMCSQMSEASAGREAIREEEGDSDETEHSLLDMALEDAILSYRTDNVIDSLPVSQSDQASSSETPTEKSAPEIPDPVEPQTTPLSLAHRQSGNSVEQDESTENADPVVSVPETPLSCSNEPEPSGQCPPQTRPKPVASVVSRKKSRAPPPPPVSPPPLPPKPASLGERKSNVTSNVPSSEPSRLRQLFSGHTASLSHSRIGDLLRKLVSADSRKAKAQKDGVTEQCTVEDRQTVPSQEKVGVFASLLATSQHTHYPLEPLLSLLDTPESGAIDSIDYRQMVLLLSLLSYQQLDELKMMREKVKEAPSAETQLEQVVERLQGLLSAHGHTQQHGQQKEPEQVGGESGTQVTCNNAISSNIVLNNRINQFNFNVNGVDSGQSPPPPPHIVNVINDHRTQECVTVFNVHTEQTGHVEVKQSSAGNPQPGSHRTVLNINSTPSRFRLIDSLRSQLEKKKSRSLLHRLRQQQAQVDAVWLRHNLPAKDSEGVTLANTSTLEVNGQTPIEAKSNTIRRLLRHSRATQPTNSIQISNPALLGFELASSMTSLHPARCRSERNFRSVVQVSSEEPEVDTSHYQCWNSPPERYASQWDVRTDPRHEETNFRSGSREPVVTFTLPRNFKPSKQQQQQQQSHSSHGGRRLSRLYRPDCADESLCLSGSRLNQRYFGLNHSASFNCNRFRT